MPMIPLLKPGNGDSHIILLFNLRWVNLEFKQMKMFLMVFY